MSPSKCLVIDVGDHAEAVDRRLSSWEDEDFGERLWRRDHTLWFEEPLPEIADRLGWLSLPETNQDQLDSITAFADSVRSEGFLNAVLLGMGGSSLAPQVFQMTFGSAEGCPELVTLDTSHPAAVRELEAGVDLARTLFIVASKSGRTLETLSLFNYFWRRVAEAVPRPGANFVAITDPGTPLEALAEEKGFERTFPAAPDLGGRYSALTAYGLVPAALIGVDLDEMLGRARGALEAFRLRGAKSPALELGAAMGELALRGRNKITFLAAPGVASFPSWLEQLVAESTGKDGKGIVPVVGEPVIEAPCYGEDRFFVLFQVKGDGSEELEGSLDGLEDAGHPTARVLLSDALDLGREIFTWEVAVASAGAILGIHPFNQPDVELSKKLARRAMEDGSFSYGLDGIQAEDAAALRQGLEAWLGGAREGDYVSIQAYLNPGAAVDSLLGEIRRVLLERTHLATTVGYGPRFLHSTGQLHKGGPNTGLFLQIVDRPNYAVGIPGEGHSFNDLIAAQAVGDYRALKERGRRVFRVGVGASPEAGLEAISGALEV